MSGKGILRSFQVMFRLKMILTVLCIALAIVCTASTVRAAIIWSGDLYPLDPNTWTSSNDGTIGQSSTGVITVDEGSTLKCGRGYLGYYYGSTGTALITGAGSKWTNSNNLYVGNSGNGSLNLEAGGQVSNAIGYIGYNSGSIGTVTVTGAGSKWTNSSGLYIGQSGNGTLIIGASGQVSNTVGYVGNLSGSTGTVTVNGAGSKWVNSGSLTIGSSGNGTLIIEAGGQVSNTDGYLGYNLDSAGIATVTGIGSNWINTNLYVGSSGRGTVTVNDGGMITVNAGLFASLDSLLGNGTISTKGAVLDANLTFDATHGLIQTLTFGTSGTLNLNQNGSGALGAGYNGDGTLRIAEGKVVASSIGYIGYQSGSAGIATVTSTGSKWTNSNYLYVGNFGSGVLNIEAGGQVSNTTGYLGYKAGSVGTANVTGTSSIWTNSSDFIAGYSGNGILNIQSSGQVSNKIGYIGYDSGSIGTVTVTGAGSKWTNSSGLYIGNTGNGTLHIGMGGLVSNTLGCIGNNSGSVGTVTVTGTGSKWTGSDTLAVGYSGDGTLNIEAGGQVSNTTCTLGVKIGSTGKVIVTGIGSKWDNQATIFVGGSGSGNLTIKDGGQVSNSSQGALGDFIGCNLGSTGIVTVTGIGSKWANSVRLYVGDSGNGTLSVEDGGQVSNTIGFIGYNAGSTGTVSVKGDGSTWTNSDNLFVGYNGSGTLTVKDGGVVNSRTLYAPLDALLGDGTIATNGAVLDTDLVFDKTHGLQQTFVFGSNGTLSLDLNGTGTLGAGYRGIGTLRICDGLQVTSSLGVLGYLSTSSGTAVVTGSGSTWSNTGSLSIGSSGIGTLRIEAAGQVNNIIGSVGDGENSSGMVTVTGIGSKWSNSGNLYVGRYGYGIMNIEAGGVVSNTQGFVGYQTGSTSNYTSMVTVTGPGSMWINNSLLHIGYSAKGALTVEAGGVVNSSTSYIGDSGIGTALVTGNGSMLTVSRDFYVGNNISCSGTLRIEAGGQVSSSWAYLGYASDASGIVTVNGAGSKWTNTGWIYLGREGRGTLNIESGGQVINGYGCFLGYLSYSWASSGTATVTGAGSAWINKDILFVGYRGNSTLNVVSGGLVTATGLTLADGSASSAICNINGGTIMTGTINAGLGSASFNWIDGTIQNYNADTDLSVSSKLSMKLDSTGTHYFNIDSGRTGTVDALLADATSGGTLNKLGQGTLLLTAANTYSGATTVEEGRFKVTGSILNASGITVEQAGIFELAKASGSATAATLNIDNAGTVLISAGSQTLGTITGSGLTQVAGSANLSAQSIVQNTLNIGGTGTASAMSTVPEPSTLALLLIATLSSLLLWRRQR